MKKRIIRFLIILAFLLLSAPIPNSNLAESFGIIYEVEAASSIKVKNADDETAQQVHNILMSGKTVTLKSSSEKKIKSLRNKMKTVNGAGVVFQYSKKGSSYNISVDNAKLYCYSVKFVKKIFKRFKEGKSYGNTWPNGYSTMNGYTEYDYYYKVYKIYKSYNTDMSFTEFINWAYDEYSRIEAQEDSYDYFSRPIDPNNEAFKETCSFADPFEKKYYKMSMTRAKIYEKAFSANNFSELSDAMKVWLISTDGYFTCHIVGQDKKYDKGFCMHYSYKKADSFRKGSGAMKKLLNGKAVGVCHDYALYEQLLWKQLGMKGYYNCNYSIDHAWSVVKAKNSSGKALWIPFDYGIGPSDIAKVSTAKKYKLYLSGIKGAPKKKNFKDSDFN